MDFVMEHIPENAASIYREIGMNNFFISVFLKENSASDKIYPNIIYGTIFYTLKERKKYNDISDDEINSLSKNKVRIIAAQDIPSIIKNKLQFEGIPCSDIKLIYYIPESPNTEKDIKGKKRIPLKIEVPIEKTDELEEETLTIVLMEKFIRNGIPLIIDEKYKYLGIKRAATNDQIEDDLLENLNIDRIELNENDEILYYYYKTKQKIVSLTGYEKDQLEFLKSKLLSEKLDLLHNELKRYNTNWEKILSYKDQLDLLNRLIGQFTTLRIGFRSPPNHINLKSYIHIVLRHFKEAQVGEYFLKKSKIPYEIADLKLLAQGVLDTVETDIKEHFQSTPEKKFTRHGDMAVYYNGDYYCIDVETNGRISSLYSYEMNV